MSQIENSYVRDGEQPVFRRKKDLKGYIGYTAMKVFGWLNHKQDNEDVLNQLKERK